MQLDETHFRESFKGISFEGKRLCQMDDPIRQSYHRGTSAALNGIIGEQICVMTGVNDFSDFFFDVCCKSRPSKDVVRNVLRDRLTQGAIVNTDLMTSYPAVLEEFEVAVHNRITPKTYAGLNKVNSLHSRVHVFLTVFNGVSTKWLCHHVAWMKWLDTFRKKDSSKKLPEIASRHIVSGNYSFRVRALPVMHIPFRNSAYNEVKLYG